MCDGQKSISCFLRLGSDDFALRRTVVLGPDTWNRMGYFLIAMLIVSSYVDSSAGRREPWKKARLPEDVEPVRYDLKLSPSFDGNDSTFNGHALIHMKVVRRTKFIIIHVKQLTIVSWTIRDRTHRNIRAERGFPYPENDYWVFQSVLSLPEKVLLELSFHGTMTTVGLNDHHDAEDSAGLYKIAYADQMTGKQSWLVATDLRPGTARLVFPCFDEPHPKFKPRFNITVFHKKIFTALSNMPSTGQNDQGTKWTETKFKLSPRINSHLVSFTVSDFGFKNTTVNGTEYRIWARRDRLNELDYALNVTKTIQQFLFQELGQPSELEKLDQFAVPGDVVHDKSENWGLATYKESKLLINTTRKEDATVERATKLIARTLTHHYFEEDFSVAGSRNHVWLKEGLTTLYAVRATKEVDSTLFFVQLYEGKERALEVDGTNESQSLIRLSDSSSEEIPDSFKPGEKGAGVLCMLESFVGVDIFRRSIRAFLEEYSNRTKVTRQLFSRIQQEFGPSLDIVAIMSSWVFDKGIPVVRVELQNGNVINATQKQFLADPSVVRSRTNQWYVPLKYRTRAGKQGLVWMNKTGAEFGVPLQSSQDWILFNGNRSGYYRVNYDTILWSRITDQLIENHTVFTEVTRSMLLNDAFHLAEAELLGYDTVLNLTKYASKERDLSTWRHIIYGIREITSGFYHSTSASRFESYVLNLTCEIVDEFLMETDEEGLTYLEGQLRDIVISRSCAAGHRRCIEIRTQLFKHWIQSQTHAIAEHAKREVYCTAMAHSVDASDWTITFERYMMDSTSESEKDLLLKTLCCSRNLTTLEWLLDFSINKTGDKPYPDLRFTVKIMSEVSLNPSAGGFLWNWFKRNYAEIDRVYYNGAAANFLGLAVSHFNTWAECQELLDFFDVYTFVPSWDVTNITRFMISKLRWVNTNFNTIVSWLDNYDAK